MAGSILQAMLSIVAAFAVAAAASPSGSSNTHVPGKHLIRREARRSRNVPHFVLESDAAGTMHNLASKASAEPKSLIAQVEGSPIKSCRHAAYDDTTNPKRMVLGTYCVDATDYTEAASGTRVLPSQLAGCGGWGAGPEGPGATAITGFYGSMEQCPVVKSCRHLTYQDNANPNRMRYGGAYCVDASGSTNDAAGATMEQAELDSCRTWTTGGGGFTPSVHLCGEAVDEDGAKCNTYVCPSSFYLRRDAPNLKCAGDTCTDDLDRSRCCKALSKEVEGKWCKGSQALNWFPDWSLEECVAWAINIGADFFVYGKGDQAQKCWWQRSESTLDCTGEACCSCSAENGHLEAACEWEEWDYDFYKLV